MTSALDALGGEGAVRAILVSLYDKLFDDVMVGFLFAGKDKLRIVDQQVAFTCAFLGGPNRYEGTPLPEAHAKLPLLPGHFDRRHHLLAQVLDAHGAPEDVRNLWLGIDEGLRKSVLSSAADARDRTRGSGADDERLAGAPGVKVGDGRR